MAAFSLNEAQLRRQAEVRALAREVLAPIAAAGRPGRVNRVLVRALGEQGLIAELVPPRQGAPAGSALDLCLLR
jgi:acyl-CoA dehydrogenase